MEMIIKNKELDTLGLILESEEPMGPRDLARVLGLSPRGGQIILQRLAQRNFTKMRGKGKYVLDIAQEDREELTLLLSIFRAALIRDKARKFQLMGRKVMHWNEEVRKALGNARKSLHQRKKP